MIDELLRKPLQVPHFMPLTREEIYEHDKNGIENNYTELRRDLFRDQTVDDILNDMDAQNADLMP